MLTNAAGPRNLARYTQYVPMLAEVEADVIESFHNGGGVPYAKYPRFQALMAESSALRFDHLLLDKMVPLAGMAEAWAADGTFLMQEIGASSHLQDNIAHPFTPFLYGLSTMHCMTVSLALDGAGLGTVRGEQQALTMLDEAGFTRVDVHRLKEDPLNNYYIARKG